MERPVVRVLDWQLTWEDPAHIEQCDPCSAGPECYWKATRGNSVSNAASWPLFQFLPPGLRPEFLSWLKDGFRSCKMKSTLSSFSCLWPWCFIPVIETLRWHRSVKLRNHLPSPSGSLAGRKHRFLRLTSPVHNSMAEWASNRNTWLTLPGFENTIEECQQILVRL